MKQSREYFKSYQKTRYRIDPEYREMIKRKNLEYYRAHKEERKLYNKLYKRKIRAKRNEQEREA